LGPRNPRRLVSTTLKYQTQYEEADVVILARATTWATDWTQEDQGQGEEASKLEADKTSISQRARIAL
jgi:hypothetical protein